MKTVLRSDKPYNFSIALFFLLTVLSLLGAAFIGEIMLPICAAFFAVLLVFEEKKHILSLICAILSIAFLFFPLTLPAVWGAASILCGAVLFLLYRFGNTKCDTAFIITLLISVLIIISFIITAFAITGDYSLNAAADFYSKLYEYIRGTFIDSLSNLALTLPEGAVGVEISEDLIIEAFDGIFNLLISFLVIISFLLAGIMLKIFTALVKIYADDSCDINNWKFILPSIYAYLYIVLFLLSAFAAGDGVIDISILNLSGIFATVFAYIGLKSAIEMFTRNGRKVLGIVVLAFAFAFFGSLAVDLVSVFGVLQTIQQNKLSKTDR